MAGVRQFDEKTLLNRSLSLFWEKGYRATSMLELSKATGVQRGSLYNAYGDKSTLFVKAFAQYRDKLLGDMQSALKQPSVKTALTNYFDLLCKRLCHETQGNGCLSTRAIMEASNDDPLIQQQLKQLLDDMENGFFTRLKQAATTGEFTGDPQKTAVYLVALTRGLAVIERTYRDFSRIQKICCTAIEMLPIDENHT